MKQESNEALVRDYSNRIASILATAMRPKAGLKLKKLQDTNSLLMYPSICTTECKCSRISRTSWQTCTMPTTRTSTNETLNACATSCCQTTARARTLPTRFPTSASGSADSSSNSCRTLWLAKACTHTRTDRQGRPRQGEPRHRGDRALGQDGAHSSPGLGSKQVSKQEGQTRRRCCRVRKQRRLGRRGTSRATAVRASQRAVVLEGH
eukprot:5736995-Pleurochrysis_carterae.AAC.1